MLDEILERIKTAVALQGERKYASISQETGLSSRAVARISEWLKQNNNGYFEATSLINGHHPHNITRPALASN